MDIKNQTIKISEKEQSGMTGRVRVFRTKDGVKTEAIPWTKNLIMISPTTGKGIILARLNSDNTYSLNITHADMGTDNTTPTDTDTTLGSASARAPKALGSISANVLTLQFFFTDANLPDDTYYEFGMFVDGGSSVDTGQIFNHVLFGTPYIKSTGEDTTVEIELTIS